MAQSSTTRTSSRASGQQRAETAVGAGLASSRNSSGGRYSTEKPSRQAFSARRNRAALADPGGAGHIVPTFRNPSPFTIGGVISSVRVFLYCEECTVKMAIGWSASRRTEMLWHFLSG